MDTNKGQGWTIKLAQKNKETQTGRPGMPWLAGSEHFPTAATFVNPGFLPVTLSTTSISSGSSISSMSSTPSKPHFYMTREEELYRRACQMKGIQVQQAQPECVTVAEEDESTGSEGETAKGVYRYTLDEMKSYNPYRFINF